jgi:hypothetical protein
MICVSARIICDQLLAAIGASNHFFFQGREDVPSTGVGDLLHPAAARRHTRVVQETHDTVRGNSCDEITIVHAEACVYKQSCWGGNSIRPGDESWYIPKRSDITSSLAYTGDISLASTSRRDARASWERRGKPHVTGKKTNEFFIP